MVFARIRRQFTYVLSFALARGALFGAPLLLANLLPAADYGRLETAQAGAAVLSNVATLGTGSVVPLVLLAQARGATMAGITAHHLALVFLCMVFYLGGWAMGLSHAWLLAALFTAALALQTLGSVHCKTLGRNEASVLLDAGLFGLMALVAAAVHLLGGYDPVAWVTAAVVAYTGTLTVIYVRFLVREQRSGQPWQWQGALAMGLPLMLGGFVSLLATTSGRLGMGLLAGPLATADYAVLSRAAALPIVAHQLILVARFRNLFTLPHADVERVSQQIVLLVALSALGFWILSPWFGFLFGPAFVAAWAAHPVPGGWIAAQAVLWSAIALNDLVIARHQVMGRILPVSAGTLALCLGAGWLALTAMGPGLAHFVYVHGAVMLLFYAAQSTAMVVAGINLWRVWGTAVASYLALILVATAFP